MINIFSHDILRTSFDTFSDRWLGWPGITMARGRPISLRSSGAPAVTAAATAAAAAAEAAKKAASSSSKFGDLPPVIALAAIGERDEVLRPTTSMTETKRHNGAYWYFLDGASFGFAPNVTSKTTWAP